jgi:hypothetical protein
MKMTLGHGLLLGLIIGGPIGFLAFALMHMAGQDDEPKPDPMIDQYDRNIPHMPRFERTQPLTKSVNKEFVHSPDKFSKRNKPFATGGFVQQRPGQTQPDHSREHVVGRYHTEDGKKFDLRMPPRTLEQQVNDERVEAYVARERARQMADKPWPGDEVV